jgi:hypothetical protein
MHSPSVASRQPKQCQNKSAKGVDRPRLLILLVFGNIHIQLVGVLGRGISCKGGQTEGLAWPTWSRADQCQVILGLLPSEAGIRRHA